MIGDSRFIGSHVVEKLLDETTLVRGPSGGLTLCTSCQHHGSRNCRPRSEGRRPPYLIGTINLLESMQGLGLSRILFLSSGGALYGIPEVVFIPEAHALRPVNSCGIVRAAINTIWRCTGGRAGSRLSAHRGYYFWNHPKWRLQHVGATGFT